MISSQHSFDALRTGRPVKCVNRNGANERLGTVAHELDAILSRPMNHKLRLTGVLDLARPGAQQQHLGFVVECLEEFRAGRTVQRTDDELAVLLFGPLQKEQGLVTFKRVYRSLNCKHDHLYLFTKAGTGRAGGKDKRPGLPLAEASMPRRGPGGSAVVRWSALVKFIGERRVA